MRVYIKFFTYIFFKSFTYVLGVMISLVFILNYLGELDFFQKMEIETSFTLFLALLNSPAMIVDMSPFIILITAQIFFVRLFITRLKLMNLVFPSYDFFNKQYLLSNNKKPIKTENMKILFFYCFNKNVIS
mgnify:CR=1 FL=1